MNSPNSTTRAALARRKETPPAGNDLRGLINAQSGEIGRALTGTALNPDRFTRVALTVVRQNAGLQRCRPESLLGALMTCAQLGLEPGPLGEAYLVPYGDQVTFIPGYRGLIKLAWNSGQLKNISARVVYANDEFTYSYGLSPDLRHVPTTGDPGKPTHVYAAATLLNGGAEFEVMTVGQVEGIRKRSKASKSGPWVTDWEAMARKTAVRQLVKWLPMTTTLNAAVQADGGTRADVSGDVIDHVAADMVFDAEPEVPPCAACGETGHDDADCPNVEVVAAATEGGTGDNT